MWRSVCIVIAAFVAVIAAALTNAKLTVQERINWLSVDLDGQPCSEEEPEPKPYSESDLASSYILATGANGDTTLRPQEVVDGKHLH